MRIVSLVPGVTEFLFAVGAGDRVVGRSHLCDYPEDAATVPAVTGGGADPAPPLSARHLLGDPPVAVDTASLHAVQPDVVIGLDGSVPAGDWEQFAFTVPQRLADVPPFLEGVAEAAAAGTDAAALVRRLKTRLARLEMLLGDRPRPRVAVIEWTAPLLMPGLWVPDLVAAAGGVNVFGTAGAPGTIADLDDLAAAAPDVVVLAFAGLSLYGAQSRLHEAMKHPRRLPATRASRVLAIDASAYVARPGPRLVAGAELLAWALHRPHPVMQPTPGRIAELIEAGWVDLAAVRPHVEESA